MSSSQVRLKASSTPNISFLGAQEVGFICVGVVIVITAGKQGQPSQALVSDWIGLEFDKNWLENKKYYPKNDWKIRRKIIT